MGKITKQLHYRKSGSANAINLYGASADVGGNRISVRDAGNTAYAPLGLPGDIGSTNLHIRKYPTAPVNATWASATAGILTTVAGSISKTGGAANTWDNVAVSNETIGANQYVSAVAGTGYAMIGLGPVSPTVGYTGINFAAYNQNGNLQVYESGVNKGSFGAVVATDVLTVAFEGKYVNYYKNGAKFYTSASTPSGIYRANIAIYTSSMAITSIKAGGDWVALSSVQDPTMLSNGGVTNSGCTVNPPTPISTLGSQPITPTLLRNVTYSGNLCVKVAGTNGGWDGGFSSVDTFPPGSEVAVTVETPNMNWMIGFSYTDPDANYTSIRWAFYVAGGYLQVYEMGACTYADPTNNQLMTCGIGDILRVRYDVNGMISFIKNATVLYTSANLASGNLIFDCTVDQYCTPFGYVTKTVYPGGSFYGWGNNVAVGYYGVVNFVEPTNASINNQYTINLRKTISLSDVDHFQLFYGDTTACSSAGPTCAPSGTTITVMLNSITAKYFYVAAINSTGTKLYTTPVYGPVNPAYTSVASQLASVQIFAANSAGTIQSTVYSGAPTITNGTWYIGGTGTLPNRYYYVRSTYNNAPSGDPGYLQSALACADTCSCNCNYCTCNCNYCTCNCNYCTCNCDYAPCNCGGCGCFRAGTKILMADGTKKNIEDVVVGELVIGMDGKPSKVFNVKVVPLEEQVWMTMEDGSIYSTGAHFYWGRLSDKEGWGCSASEEHDEKIRAGLKPNLKEGYLDFEDAEVEYATIDGWKRNRSIIISGDPEEMIYQLEVEGSHSYIANGYVVGGKVTDEDFDYQTIQWEGLKLNA
ncbi:MAG: Hint domain-containing homing endonuclease [Negativicutes bacterium]|nr:Hint domain-containing homing endonuclease [Negativicutes bacterium]